VGRLLRRSEEVLVHVWEGGKRRAGHPPRYGADNRAQRPNKVRPAYATYCICSTVAARGWARVISRRLWSRPAHRWKLISLGGGPQDGPGAAAGLPAAAHDARDGQASDRRRAAQRLTAGTTVAARASGAGAAQPRLGERQDRRRPVHQPAYRSHAYPEHPRNWVCTRSWRRRRSPCGGRSSSARTATAIRRSLREAATVEYRHPPAGTRRARRTPGNAASGAHIPTREENG
jgi:hypothetical protein